MKCSGCFVVKFSEEISETFVQQWYNLLPFIDRFKLFRNQIAIKVLFIQQTSNQLQIQQFKFLTCSFCLFPLFLFQNTPPSSMKKYQLWLQRKSYSQHLINLIKIKTAVHTPQNIDKKHRKMASDSSAHQSRDSAGFHQGKVRDSFRLGDISYPILNRQLKRKKLQLLRSFEIQKQNENMARRMKLVKSVVSFQRQAPSLSTDFFRRKTNEKKYEHSNEELRESKFRRYIKWQSNTVSALHRYYLTIEVVNLGRLIRMHDDFAGLWCEVETERGTVKSDINDLNKFASYKYSFPLQHDMGEKIVLKLFTCRGIEAQKIGQFQVQRPPSTQKIQGWYKSTDCRFQIQLNVKYNKVIRNKPCVLFK